MQKGLWENEEVKFLFQTVEEVKYSGRPLKEAFAAHAKKYCRQPNSVRNYYYHEVDNLSKDVRRRESLKIDIEKHRKTSIVYFSPEQEKDLMQKIQKMVENGCSVRKACFTLANGDVGQMLRYQNKYRNFVAKKNEKASNIIKFTTKKKESLSDSDLNSLFIGLVRLVKRTAVEELNEKHRFEKENANNLLRKAIADLGKKEDELKSLKESFAKLKHENAILMQSVIKNKRDKTDKLSQKLRKTYTQLSDSPSG